MIPYEVDNVELIGHAELLAALAAGASQALILKSPKTAKTAIENQSALTHRLLGATRVDTQRVKVIEADDIASHLKKPCMERECQRLGMKKSHCSAVVARLPNESQLRFLSTMASHPVQSLSSSVTPTARSKSTRISVRYAWSVSQCPTGALNDRSDRPEINIVENACVQCGLCANTCPEQAITLKPRLSFGPQTLEQTSLHGEDPFECIECGRPFGVKSTIERIIEKLEGNHWMYTDSDNTKLVKMCDDCRINAQYHDANAPLRGPDRPRVRTTDDYLDS